MSFFADCHWISEEFEGIDFGDTRLNDRFLTTAYLIAECPGSSIWAACGDKHQAKASYRMFDNEKIDSSEIFASHRDKTLERIQSAGSVVLAIQDTTFLNYNSRADIEGLGHIGTVGKVHNQGLVMHSILAFDPKAEVALGLIDQTIWSRKKEPIKHTARERKLLPIQKKESMKWLKGLHATKDLLGDLKKQVVTVADREADIFEFMNEAQSLGQNFVIRATRNRKILKDNAYSLIWDELLDQEVAGKMEVQVPARAGKKKRKAILEVRFCSLLIKPTVERPEIRHSSPVKVYGVLARETRAAKDGTQLEWLLLTDIEVRNYKEAVEKVDWYKCRWQIEVFHKVLKSVCRVESCGLRSADQLKKFITLASVTAWKLQWMIHVSRTAPTRSCKEILEESEWKILAALSVGKKGPKGPPTIKEAVLWIAKLGGFGGRKSDGDPGVITLSRGWLKLKTTVSHWVKLQESEFCG